MDQIEIISRQLMIIVGITMCIFGSIGNILNICVFTIWSRRRKPANQHHNHGQTSNSPLYLLASSIANLILIIYPLPVRILFDGYQYRVTQNKVFILCKLRYYALHACDLISLTCICMATFDRYLISSRKVRLRQLSTTIQRTKLIIILIVLLFGLHSVPIAIYYQTSDAGQCIIYSTSYLNYYRYTVQIILHGIIPIIFFSVFGLLTLKQLKTIQNRNQHVNVDKQLSRMLLLMSITIVLSSIPYSIESTYYLIFADSSQQQTSYIFLFHIISSLFFYTNSVCMFYVFYISTPNFRIQVKKIILCKKQLNRFMNNSVHAITVGN